ncbi:3-hydroxyacyl-CoA dehydrogenase NAD-binding domain-containing protein [Ruegeria sp. Ofav3-42]|uniref:3-hydroxyacyl-CoA dehydrogenase NAD-binding domain-containing protein n=1 Tax=Ruegeria sp. Ofav3-42 TaxID=2917759 RepID=UPI001EF4C368|nr:3-hydroxyacyl-CoA dehydrogenase NAD-binding domain-containing protein [Ruegeria sp. Ofav3-42]MCG7521434.1 3-hydroxyacyl-CoA dehydrogenase NAD-binding domain-containing protein [Ruegeria sp. Ofav3-42]
MSAVKVTRTEQVGLIRVDAPPVNAISQAVRQGLWDAFQAVSADPEVAVVVLICAGRTFMAGADASELGKPPVPPHLNDLVLFIESCPKPVVAAIHGQALGGGLEIALACSHRIATADARLGLPEVNLGFVPGAGGTQRLPRLIGVEPALEMAVEGKPVSAQKALESGLINAIADDLEPDALSFATTLAGVDPTLFKLNRPIGPDSFDPDVFDQWRAMCAKRKRGLDAPLAVINAVQAATGSDFQAGLDAERALSLELRKSPQSTALRHIFFAERATHKVEGLDLSQAAEINSVAVIGAGTMGAGIAQVFASQNIPVTLVEISDEAAQAGIERVRSNLEQAVKRGKLDCAHAEVILAKVTPTTDYQDLAQSDLVIEAAVEDMAIKKKIFEKLDQVCHPTAILATNTSYLDIDEIASATARPDRVAGLHFFSPAQIMKLVEVIRTDRTAPEVTATLAAVMKKLGKIGVIAGVCHGFIGNRMYQAYQREAGLLMLECGSPETVDAALRRFGMAMGPFQVLDLSGIDIGYLMRKSLPDGTVHPNAFQVHDQLVEMGRKGRKTQAGFYRYDGGNATLDEDVRSLIQSVAEKAGIARRMLSDHEIAERCIHALHQEGANILREGIAEKPGDIDVVFVNGYGFPRYKGGPMHHSSG